MQFAPCLQTIDEWTMEDAKFGTTCCSWVLSASAALHSNRTAQQARGAERPSVRAHRAQAAGRDPTAACLRRTVQERLPASHTVAGSQHRPPLACLLNLVAPVRSEDAGRPRRPTPSSIWQHAGRTTGPPATRVSFARRGAASDEMHAARKGRTSRDEEMRERQPVWSSPFSQAGDWATLGWAGKQRGTHVLDESPFAPTLTKSDLPLLKFLKKTLKPKKQFLKIFSHFWNRENFLPKKF
jgi:hypothetical protein